MNEVTKAVKALLDERLRVSGGEGGRRGRRMAGSELVRDRSRKRGNSWPWAQVAFRRRWKGGCRG